MKQAKSLNQQICEFVEANPLCTTRAIAEAFDISSIDISKRMNLMEISDHVRGIKVSNRRNLWILGSNQRFREGRSNPRLVGRGNGGGVYYPNTGHIDRKRLVTITVSANDALALLSKGYSRLQVA